MSPTPRFDAVFRLRAHPIGRPWRRQGLLTTRATQNRFAAARWVFVRCIVASNQGKTRMGAHVALDIGGTFTDLVYFNDSTGELRHSKSSTTPEDFTLGIENCLNKAKVAISDCETF